MLTSLLDLKQMVPRALCEMSIRKLKVNTRPLCGPLPTSHFGICLFPPILISHIPASPSSLCAQRPPTEHYRPSMSLCLLFLPPGVTLPTFLGSAPSPPRGFSPSHLPFLSSPCHKGSALGSLAPLYEILPNNRNISLLHL